MNAKDRGRAFPITAVSLDTEHKPSGVVDIIVKIEISGYWIEVIRTPYPDGGVIGHCVTSLGIEAKINPGLDSMRECGRCKRRHIPRGFDWPWWEKGRPVDPTCDPVL